MCFYLKKKKKKLYDNNFFQKSFFIQKYDCLRVKIKLTLKTLKRQLCLVIGIFILNNQVNAR